MIEEFVCKAVIFDFDGVLVDSNAIYEKHWKAWADQHHIEVADILAVHHGIPPTRTIGLVAPHLDAAHEAKKFVAGCSDDVEGAVKYPGTSEIIAQLAGMSWAIATSSTRNMVLPRLEHLALPVPEVLVTIDDVAEGKPAPDSYLMAARKLGFEPADCVVVEDAPAGVKAAKLSGAQVNRSYNYFET